MSEYTPACCIRCKKKVKCEKNYLTNSLCPEAAKELLQFLLDNFHSINALKIIKSYGFQDQWEYLMDGLYLQTPEEMAKEREFYGNCK